jgi:methylase of polypeptide subunit release factors
MIGVENALHLTPDAAKTKHVAIGAGAGMVAIDLAEPFRAVSSKASDR